MRTTRPVFEYIVAVAAFATVLGITLATQERIAVNDGRGYDGTIYYSIAEQLLEGNAPEGVLRFASRLGTPLLAAAVRPGNLLEGFLLVNLSAAFVSTLLFVAWLRRYLQTPWLRILLTVVYVGHWLQLARFTVFYPVLVDACAQALCFAGLNCIASYEKSPSVGKLAAIAAISAVGAAFRDVVMLVPLAFLFVTGTRSHWLRTSVPLALSIAVFATLRNLVIVTDASFSTSGYLLERVLSRSVLSYVLGWFVAYGPALFVVLFDWRSAAAFFGRHRWALVYIGGVAAAGWAGSLESERHALNWGAPIVYLLIGFTIERHLHWFKGVLAVILAGSQALIARLFWTIPQPREDYLQQTPWMVLTPIGPATTYLHLFPDYVTSSLAWLQFWQFVLLGGVILGMMWSHANGGLAGAWNAAVGAARMSVARVRRPSLSHAVWVLVTFASAGGAATTVLVDAYRMQPISINVRWKEGVSPLQRKQIERILSLSNGVRAEGTTWEYVLADPSEAKIRAVVRHPAVEDTAHVDRESFRREGADQIERQAGVIGILIGVAVAIAAVKLARPRDGVKELDDAPG